MKKQIEVFVTRLDEEYHSYWAGEPASIGFWTQEEIDRGEDKEYGGPGQYSYSYC